MEALKCLLTSAIRCTSNENWNFYALLKNRKSSVEIETMPAALSASTFLSFTTDSPGFLLRGSSRGQR